MIHGRRSFGEERIKIVVQQNKYWALLGFGSFETSWGLIGTSSENIKYHLLKPDEKLELKEHDDMPIFHFQVDDSQAIIELLYKGEIIITTSVVTIADFIRDFTNKYPGFVTSDKSELNAYIANMKMKTVESVLDKPSNLVVVDCTHKQNLQISDDKCSYIKSDSLFCSFIEKFCYSENISVAKIESILDAFAAFKVQYSECKPIVGRILTTEIFFAEKDVSDSIQNHIASNWKS